MQSAPGQTTFQELSRFAVGVVVRLFTVVVALGSSVITARGLGAEGRGLLYTCTAAAGLGAQLLSFGMPSAIVLLVSSRPEFGRRAIGRGVLAAASAGIGFLLFVRCASLLTAGRYFSAHWHHLSWTVSGLVAGQVLLYWCSSLTQALGAVDRLPSFEFSYRFTSASWSWIMLFMIRASFPVFLWSLVIVDLFCGLAWMAYLYHIAPPTQGPMRWPREWAGWAARAFPLLLLSSATRRVDTLMVTSFAGLRATGLYSIATQVLDVSQVAVVFLGQKAMYLHAAGLGDSPSVRLLRKSLPVAILAVMVLAGWSADAWAVPLFGAEFRGVGPIIYALAIGAAALAWETAAAPEVAAAGFPVGLTLSWFASFAVEAVLLAVSVPKIGAVGAGATLTCTYLSLALMVYRVRRGVRIRAQLDLNSIPKG